MAVSTIWKSRNSCFLLCMMTCCPIFIAFILCLIVKWTSRYWTDPYSNRKYFLNFHTPRKKNIFGFCSAGIDLQNLCRDRLSQHILLLPTSKCSSPLLNKSIHAEKKVSFDTWKLMTTEKTRAAKWQSHTCLLRLCQRPKYQNYGCADLNISKQLNTYFWDPP